MNKKMQILTCEILDSTGAYLMIKRCVGFSEIVEKPLKIEFIFNNLLVGVLDFLGNDGKR